MNLSKIKNPVLEFLAKLGVSLITYAIASIALSFIVRIAYNTAVPENFLPGNSIPFIAFLIFCALLIVSILAWIVYKIAEKIKLY